MKERPRILFLCAVAALLVMGGFLHGTDPDEITRIPLESLDRSIETLAEHSRGATRPIPTDRGAWETERLDILQALDRSLGVSRIYGQAPLDARVSGRKRLPGGISARTILFDAEPGMAVSALLFEPPAEPPLPTVILFAGHTGHGKASREYAPLIAEILRRGMAVLAVDEIGGGERAFTGQQMPELFRMGVTPGGVQIRDGKRAVDLLSALPGVDPRRIGAVGHSGGGFQAFYLAALDERIASAVAIKYVSSYLGMIRSDTEHTIDNYLLYPLRDFEQRHVLAAIAPRPFMVISSYDDIFPVHDAGLAVRDAARAYRLHGIEDLPAFEVFEGGHDLTRRDAAEAAEFLARQLGGDELDLHHRTLVRSVERGMSLHAVIPPDKRLTLADLAARLSSEGAYRQSPLPELSPIAEPAEGILSAIVMSDGKGTGDIRRRKLALGRDGRFLLQADLLHAADIAIERAYIVTHTDRHGSDICEREIADGGACLLVEPRKGSTEQPLWPRFGYDEYRTWGNALLAGYPLERLKEEDLDLARRYLTDELAVDPAAISFYDRDKSLTETKYRLYSSLTSLSDSAFGSSLERRNR